MREVIWLTASRDGIRKMTKNQPDLWRGEIPVKLEVVIDDAVFGAPVLEQRIHVTDWREGLAFADPELKDKVITEAEAEMIRQQRLTAMTAVLEARGYQVTAPPGDDDD